MRLKYHPLTPDRWDDFEALFGPRGACGGCWCMYWRLPRKDFEAGKSGGNRIALRTIVQGGREPGLLAYDGGRAVGWCSVAPRAEFDYLARSRVLRPIDDTPAWSVSCLFVAKEFRGRGVAVGLLKAAAGFVKAHGGRVIEGYPVVPRKRPMPAVLAWTGTPAAFERAGFAPAAVSPTGRPIMRRRLGRSPTT
jgi:GNAT superfamily N-acetyltransferase